MQRFLRTILVAVFLPWSTAQQCYDAAGNSFAGNDVAYFLDQRYNCTIMICHSGTPRVLRQICYRKLNITIIQGVKPPKVEAFTGSCVPIHQCPEAVDDARIFCPLPSGSRGVVCSANNDITDFVPHEVYPNLEKETLHAISSSALPRATKQILASLPEETADGRSETEAALQAAVQSASRATREAVVKAADDYVGKMENFSDQLLATGQLPPVTTSTYVFNLNFRNSPKVRQIALKAVRDLSMSTLFLSSRAKPSGTTPQPKPLPTGRPSGLPSKQRVADPTANRATSQRAGPTRFTTAFDQREVTVRPSSAPRVNQTCLLGRPLFCDATAIYRTADGSCNNLRRPLWGRNLTPLRRIFRNTYSDGIFSPTSSASLPNPRLLSERLMDLELVPAQQRTLAVMTWGQFMDHDMVHTPIFQLEDSHGIECCSHPNAPPPEPPVHPQCLPIPIRAADAFYGPHMERCMNFVRSVPATRPDCRLGPANQLNDITHWIDGSQVYGSSREKQTSLRTLSGGLLRSSPGHLLPRETPLTSEDGTNTTASCRGHVCFVAGDSRANENPMLTMYHTLFMREHNRIANALKQYGTKPSSPATDEQLFQRARRILIAQWQHISYNEWLPTLLGYGYAESVGLYKAYGDFSHEYLGFLNPSISNSFATAGFRLHSLIQDALHFVTASGNTTTTVPLHETFFKPSVLLTSGSGDSGGIARLARGITKQSPRVQDRHFSGQIHGQLFATDCVGLDLVTLNIQRGRDHGLAKYHTVLRWCTGVRVRRWSDLNVVMTTENLARLRSVYSDWAEIDMYAGINMERMAPGAMLGPTARCLITEQFIRLRFSDRFFYDLGGQPGSFTRDQLTQLRRASWARLLCDTVGGDFTAIQPLAFFQPNDVFNPVTDCDLLPGVDLSVF